MVSRPRLLFLSVNILVSHSRSVPLREPEGIWSAVYNIGHVSDSESLRFVEWVIVLL